MNKTEAKKICKELRELNFDAEIKKNPWFYWLDEGKYSVSVSGRIM